MKCIFFILFYLLSCCLWAVPCQTDRQIFIENTEVKVWRTTICPKELLGFHSHIHSRILIPLSNGRLKVIYRSGRSEMMSLHQQVPIFLDEKQGREEHQDLNLGVKPLNLIVVELR